MIRRISSEVSFWHEHGHGHGYGYSVGLTFPLFSRLDRVERGYDQHTLGIGARLSFFNLVFMVINGNQSIISRLKTCLALF